MTELVLVIQLSLTKKAEKNPRNVMIEITLSIYWAADADLLEYSYTPLDTWHRTSVNLAAKNCVFIKVIYPVILYLLGVCMQVL